DASASSADTTVAAQNGYGADRASRRYEYWQTALLDAVHGERAVQRAVAPFALEAHLEIDTPHRFEAPSGRPLQREALRKVDVCVARIRGIVLVEGIHECCVRSYDRIGRVVRHDIGGNPIQPLDDAPVRAVAAHARATHDRP